MEFSPTTFALEIINFLVLVALLKHWFYTPVLNSIERRREAMQAELDSAEATRQEALALHRSLEEKREQQVEELREAHEKLSQELRERREQFQKDLEEERVKAREAGKAELEAEARHYQLVAVEQGSRFAARLLGKLAGPPLQELLVEAAVKELDRLQEEDRNALQGVDRVKVTSAFPLSQTSRSALETSLGELEVREDKELVCGIALGAGDCYLGANLKDELELFRRAWSD